MATKIKELYDKNASLEAGLGGPDAPKVDANLNIDQTPYSTGTNKAGAGQPDEDGMNTVLNRPLNPYKGNRYGLNVGGTSIGDVAGYKEWPKRKDGVERPTWNDTKKYGDSPRV